MVSEKPWSEYKASDYTVEQWHRACLIHQHLDTVTSKAQCKLPVRTPNGAVNRNGVHAAAAVLAGARGGINASSDDINKAKASVRRLYSELDEDPPASLSHAKGGGNLSKTLTLDEELILDRNPLFEGEEFFEENIQHYGTKGMKWGVRNDRGHEGQQVKTKKLPKLDKKWERDFNGVTGFIAMHNGVASKMNNGRIDRINNKPEYKGVNMFSAKNKKIADKYFDDMAKEQLAAYHEVAKEYGSNPSGTRKLSVELDKRSGEYSMRVVDIQHAAFDPLDDLEWTGKLDSTGHIVSVDLVEEDEIEQSAIENDVNPLLSVEDFFEEHIQHYGIKGMKWGRRKAVREGASAEAEQASGIHARVSVQKSTSMLTNKELKDAIERMRLEQQYSQMSGGLDKTRRQKVSAFIDELITGTVNQQANQLANGQVKDMIDQKMKAGRHDPVTIAERNQKITRLQKSGAM